MHFHYTPTHLFFNVLFALFIGYLAYRQGRNPYVWFAIGLLLGLAGVFALLFVPRKKGGVKKGTRAPRKRLSIPTQKQPVSPPEPQIIGPSHKHWYYLDAAHTTQGPMSFQAFTKALRQGMITKTTYVWHEDLSDWKPLNDLIR